MTTEEETKRITKIAVAKQLLDSKTPHKLTDDEFDVIYESARSRGLSLLNKQAHVLSHRDRDTGVVRLSLHVGIDGLRAIAASTGDYLGTEGPHFYVDGKWVDVWIPKSKEWEDAVPQAARMSVFRRNPDGGEPFKTTVFALGHEYRPDKMSPMWMKRGASQLAKCAEAIACRRAFPDELGGLSSDDYVDSGDAATRAAAEVTEATDDNTKKKGKKKTDDEANDEGGGEVRMTAKQKREALSLANFCEYVDGLTAKPSGDEVAAMARNVAPALLDDARAYYAARVARGFETPLELASDGPQEPEDQQPEPEQLEGEQA